MVKEKFSNCGTTKLASGCHHVRIASVFMVNYMLAPFILPNDNIIIVGIELLLFIVIIGVTGKCSL